MSDLITLRKLFQQRLFRIPDYQRGYAWGNPQLTDFWEDLMNLDKSRYHYIGLLSLRKVDPAEARLRSEDVWMLENDFATYHVVDGQQRLTTISILMFELLRFVKSLPENKGKSEKEILIGHEHLEKLRETFVMQTDPKHDAVNTYLFGYESDNPSEVYLRHQIFEEPNGGELEDTLYTRNLANAKRFFVENLKAIYDREGLVAIESLYRKTVKQLKFMLHVIDDDYDVYTAFEAMNNRGKQLSNLEKFKNRLIYLVTLFNDTRLSPTNKKIWRDEINKAWTEVYRQLGRSPNLLLDDDEFLRSHWIVYYKYSRKQGNDYINFLLDKFSVQRIFDECLIVTPSTTPTIQSDFEEDDDEPETADPDPAPLQKGDKIAPEEILLYVQNLKGFAQHWYSTFKPESVGTLTIDEIEWIEKLNRIGIGYFRPLVAVSLGLGDKVNVAQRIELFKAIERFIFVCFRVGTIRQIWKSSVFYRKAGFLSKGDTTIENLIEEINKFTAAELESVAVGFVNQIGQLFKSGHGFYNWHGIGYFLYEYEFALAKNSGESKVEWTSVAHGKKDSIEHVFPQSPVDPYWQERFGQFTEPQKKCLMGSLGNLLLLNRALNASFSNHPFPQKRDGNGQINERGYRNGSNSEIEVAKYKDWTKESILERGRHLLNWAKERWNIPFTDDQMDALLGLSLFSE